MNAINTKHNAKTIKNFTSEFQTLRKHIAHRERSGELVVWRALQLNIQVKQSETKR